MASITSDPAISLDGFIAGPDQNLENPLGVGGEALHRWMFEQPEENAAEIDAICSAGAYVMGRNMFGPDRGEWDLDWHGWWGEDPPYHGPVFVLGHREREPVPRWRAGRRSTSSPAASRRPSGSRARRPATATSRSAAAPRRSTSTSQPATSTSFASTSRRSCSARARPLFRDLRGLSFEVASSRSTSLVTHVTLRR